MCVALSVMIPETVVAEQIAVRWLKYRGVCHQR